MDTNISLMLAFSAGLVSFLSPCVLPLVPAYLTYLIGDLQVSSDEKNNRKGALKKALGFVIGFSIIFILLGASATAIGQLLGEQTKWLRIVGGALILGFGLQMTGLLKFSFLEREIRVFKLTNDKPLGSLLLGMAFAAGWTPCIGPILASILIIAGSQETLWNGVFLLVMYSAGFSIPFFLFAATLDSMHTFVKKWAKYLPGISIGSGVVLVIVGLLMIFDRLKYLNTLFI